VVQLDPAGYGPGVVLLNAPGHGAGVVLLQGPGHWPGAALVVLSEHGSSLSGLTSRGFG
jgi:hypothetical protein